MTSMAVASGAAPAVNAGAMAAGLSAGTPQPGRTSTTLPQLPNTSSSGVMDLLGGSAVGGGGSWSGPMIGNFGGSAVGGGPSWSGSSTSGPTTPSLVGGGNGAGVPAFDILGGGGGSVVGGGPSMGSSGSLAAILGGAGVGGSMSGGWSLEATPVTGMSQTAATTSLATAAPMPVAGGGALGNVGMMASLASTMALALGALGAGPSTTGVDADEARRRAAAAPGGATATAAAAPPPPTIPGATSGGSIA